MDMEPLLSQAMVDEDNNQDAIVDVNVAEPPALKRPRKNPTLTGTRASSSKRKLQFTTDDVVGGEDEQPSSSGKNA